MDHVTATQPALMKPGTTLGRLTFFRKRSQLSCQEQLVSFPSYCFCKWWFHKMQATDLSNEKVGGAVAKKTFKIKWMHLPPLLLHISHVSASWNRPQATRALTLAPICITYWKKKKNHLHRHWTSFYRLQMLKQIRQPYSSTEQGRQQDFWRLEPCAGGGKIGN